MLRKSPSTAKPRQRCNCDASPGVDATSDSPTGKRAWGDKNVNIVLGCPAGSTQAPHAPLAFAARLHTADAALLRQGRHRRPHAATRSPRPGLPEVPRHRMLFRRVVDGDGPGQPAGLAGKRKGRVAGLSWHAPPQMIGCGNQRLSRWRVER